jgi:hypothetical protein
MAESVHFVNPTTRSTHVTSQILTDVHLHENV